MNNINNITGVKIFHNGHSPTVKNIPDIIEDAVANGIADGYSLSQSSEWTFLINDNQTIKNAAMETVTNTSKAPKLNQNLLTLISYLTAK